MEFQIEFFKDSRGKSPVEEFLTKLYTSNRKLLVKTRGAIEKLRYKAFHKEPLSKHLESGLWELRVKSGSNIVRVIYTFAYGRVTILLHGFTKKSQKTPARELEVARKRLRELKGN